MKTKEELNALQNEQTKMTDDLLENVTGGHELKPTSPTGSTVTTDRSSYQISPRMRPQNRAPDAANYNPQPADIADEIAPNTAEILDTFRENANSSANGTGTDI